MKLITLKNFFLLILMFGIQKIGFSANSVPITTPLDFTNISLYVFGDSMSDVGNSYQGTVSHPIPIPPLTRYFNGRYANGYNTADSLWLKFGYNTQIIPSISKSSSITPINFQQTKQAISFAYAGSNSGFASTIQYGYPVLGLQGQVGMFRVLKTDSLPIQNAVAVIWVGTNDYLGQYPTSQITVADITDKVVSRISTAILNLSESGISHFIVSNLFDLGQTPYALNLVKYDATIPSKLSNTTIEHNQKLNTMLTNLMLSQPHIKIYPIDIYTLFKNTVTASQVVSGPASGCIFGVINATNCASISFNVNSNVVFWDELHPTTYIDGLIANLYYQALIANP